MTTRKSSEVPSVPAAVEVSDNDVYEAMKEIQGYLDITPADLKVVMNFAYRHALQRLSRSVRAKDIMTSPVHQVEPQVPLRDVALLMAEKGISGMPVVGKDGTVLGIISTKDFLAHMGMKNSMHLMDVIAECLKGERCLTAPILEKKAGDIMTSPVVCIGGDRPISEIADLLTTKGIGRVPVTSEGGKLIGIVSKTDLVRLHLLKADQA